ncbi:MAG: glycosyltransferase family 4 protein [Candidatus Levybacteria bacterium CG_4_9_14_3_um_filter_35_16]|nr:MAG: glycosyl transferase [Candidatus Levybacteria bacterium CG22_combo_CG10-13_8_21_14_all_35_11]PJA91034.1 MAG: glycosyltransferase family 4 protein [Candidatus Levybacteria bacterium CG_4_9_14_3_um_filter_35_16]PJC54729.1 MAG: glycosyltransferase family 4 protein [Candidatus Levybacteria bacterium CG_4_9_14_0_2_um_filter_35_21]
MKIAIVHDYIKEFGGAERVLKALCEVYPDAPIYTAFYDKNSTAFEHFKDKKIITSWFQYLPYSAKLASPLRFLTPLIWRSFSFLKFDVVISSASWYITKGFGSRQNLNLKFKIKNLKLPVEVCYCHTPPRWLYGYSTSVNFQKYFIVKIYAAIVGFFLRRYDFNQAQKVNYFIANSEEVKSRIKKFYKRESTVIYPPVSLPKGNKQETINKKDYYFIVSRIVGAKGLDLAVETAIKGNFKLKIAGSPAGYYFEYKKLMDKVHSTSSGQVEFVGQVSDEDLVKLYTGAKAFLALAKDEDFGITPVEAMSCGTPVIAFNGGGYKETVINNKTGILFDNYSIDGLITAIKEFESLRQAQGKQISEDCIEQAEKFSKERFKNEIKDFVNKVVH